MITRRATLAGLLMSSMMFGTKMHAAEVETPIDSIDDFEYPSFDSIDPIKQFGVNEPTEAQKIKAKSLWSAAPMGPKPIDVVNYFIDSVANSDSDAVSQWPKVDAWNPLVVEFFRSTGYRADNDMVPWCAAFVNWCLLRTSRAGSGSAASQSFLDQKAFKLTLSPELGDLAVFTCYDVVSGLSVGLGHVSFVAGKPGQTQVMVAGGNQAQGGKSMICRKPYPLSAVKSSRIINGEKTPVIFKFNTYVKIV